jgi:hypothetical protein
MSASEPEKMSSRVAQELKERAGREGLLWRHCERVRWQALVRNERSWDEKSETGAVELYMSSLVPSLRLGEVTHGHRD